MLVAAAITSVMKRKPTVVGGTAEEFWTHDEYRPTDLGLIPDPTAEDEKALKELGLRRDGRFWMLDEVPLGAEFPYDDSFEVRRTVDTNVAGVSVKVIGIDDLYLDRLRQSTSTENPRDTQFASVLAVLATNWDELDWKYINGRIAEIVANQPALGKSMMKMNQLARRQARGLLAKRRAAEL